MEVNTFGALRIRTWIINFNNSLTLKKNEVHIKLALITDNEEE
jgi:hypothetical protein